MKFGVYVIRDFKTGFLPSVSLDQNDESAIRGFSMAINNPGGVIGFAPQDFELFKIGVFDVDKGLLDAFAVPELVACGIDCVTSSER